MINSILGTSPDLKISLAQASNEQDHTLIDELNSIAPEMAQELLSLFNEEIVEQLLHQQFSSLYQAYPKP